MSGDTGCLVFVDGPPGHPRWASYGAELLDHLRLPYRRAPRLELEALEGARLLVFAAAPDVDAHASSALRDWVRGGGVLVCVGAGSLGAAFGVADGTAVPEGRVVVGGAPPWVDELDTPLFARGGCSLTLSGRDDLRPIVAATWQHDASAAAVITTMGEGAAVFIGADVWQSIVRLQQGDPVDTDGVPAPDGSADVADGVLKCDDGIVLSYETDRAVPPPGRERDAGRAGLEPVPIFHRPHADLWRRVVVQLLVEGASRAGVPLPWIHYWPSGVPAVAHLSVDSDRNSIDDAITTLDLFAEVGVRATWCHVYPGGYDRATVERIAAEGHEHALHYNAVGDADIASWGWAQLRAQYAWAQAMTGADHILSNKNHYTRWEGWDEFYRWCERLGIQIDETRGPSKRGNVGFPFGTCHVTQPMSTGSWPDVLMLPLHAQDLAWATHESVRDVILEQVIEHHGVAHFLFHPVHLHRQGYVRDACRDLVAEARRRGMRWWMAAEINAWARLRRSVSLDLRLTSSTSAEVELTTPTAVDDLAVLMALPAAGETLRASGPVPIRLGMAERHGRRMHELTLDVPQGTTTVEIRWTAPNRTGDDA